MAVRIINADVLLGLSQIEDESVNCCVTSPPYWGLRDYGVAGQIGLEATPEAFVAKMVEVFRAVRRVLSNDGTLWLNLGDSYAGCGVIGRKDTTPERLAERAAKYKTGTGSGSAVGAHGQRRPATVLKAKDLVGIPWMVAFALRADGWYLRQEIIWAKQNPMPESVRDRCTKAHEHIFLLSKSDRYWFDADAIAERQVKGASGSEFHTGKTGTHQMDRASQKPRSAGNKKHKYVDQYEAEEGEQHRTKAGLMRVADAIWEKRNKRSVWTIASQPFAEAHFATFPEALPENCIKAGCPSGGTVLDPFGGAGTTGLVADKLGRNAILIELNPEYAAMAERRITDACPLFANVMPAADTTIAPAPAGLFDEGFL